MANSVKNSGNGINCKCYQCVLYSWNIVRRKAADWAGAVIPWKWSLCRAPFNLGWKMNLALLEPAVTSVPLWKPLKQPLLRQEGPCSFWVCELVGVGRLFRNLQLQGYFFQGDKCHFKSPGATPSYLFVRVNEERNKIMSPQLLLKRENAFYQLWKHLILFRLQGDMQLMHADACFQVSTGFPCWCETMNFTGNRQLDEGMRTVRTRKKEENWHWEQGEQQNQEFGGIV